ncbi:MAG: hypothetical protein ACJAVA_000302 [Flavobacteriaceae bacterium]|jgi:hypothetical protein
MSEIIEEYKGYTIKAWHHTDAENPFESWDCNLPTMATYDRNINDYSKGDINEYLKYILTDNQIIRHQKAIAEIFEIDLDYFKEQEFSKDDKISDIRDEIGNSKDFDALALICELSKTPYLNSNSRGYSQGDYSDVFICYTQNFEKITGCTKKQIDEKFLQSTLDLFSAWAWGDVYGFEIEETEDNCGGFYGDDHEKSGLLEHARAEIDAAIERKRKTKQSKLKTLVKNRVPLAKRELILN